MCKFYQGARCFDVSSLLGLSESYLVCESSCVVLCTPLLGMLEMGGSRLLPIVTGAFAVRSRGLQLGRTAHATRLSSAPALGRRRSPRRTSCHLFLLSIAHVY